jgi:Cof subfamily protein (haloacid dehalogenase superfamily)
LKNKLGHVSLKSKEVKAMIKLIASDIDGTLVPEGSYQINSEIFDVIRKLKQKGITFVAASGRHYSSVVKLFEPVKDEIAFICDNGSLVKYDGKVIFLGSIDEQLAKAVMKDIQEIPGAETLVSCADTVYTDSYNTSMTDWMLNGYRYNLNMVDDLQGLQDDSIIKVTLYHDVDAEGVAKDTLIPKWQDQLQIVCAGEKWIDCTKLGVSKGYGIQKLQEILGITREETMAFGDNMNDIDMLKKAYHSYAMGNARQEVKAITKNIADTSENNGVLAVLYSLLGEYS